VAGVPWGRPASIDARKKGIEATAIAKTLGIHRQMLARLLAEDARR
jgi:hypothetical protein